jgi:hypothetical protein
MSRPSGGPATLGCVTHIELIPMTDGRHIIFRAVVLTPGERLRRFARRLRGRR